MNIKNRIKRIEDGLNLDSDFCRCEREIVIKVEPRDENGELPPPAPAAVCKNCGKEISQRHFTFNFNNNIETELILPPYKMIEPGDESPEEQNQL